MQITNHTAFLSQHWKVYKTGKYKIFNKDYFGLVTVMSIKSDI